MERPGRYRTFGERPRERPGRRHITGLSNSFGINNLTNAGSYTLNVAGTLTNPNYTVSSTNTGSWAVNPATLTYLANPASSTYGSAGSPLSGTVTGFVNSDTLASATTGAMSFNSRVRGVATLNVGSYAINGSGLTANNGNYVLTQAPANATALTITPATLTYTASAASSTYGSAIPSLVGTVTGFVNGDTQTSATSGSLSFGTAATPSSNAGSYAVNGSGLTSDSNYVLVQASGNTTALTIAPAPITVAALGGASTYGASPANPGLTASGLQNGQSVSALSGISNSFGINALTGAGSYTLSVAGTLTNPNYRVTSANTGTWAVNPASITVTALGGSSTYGSSPSNPGLSAIGLQNGQSAAVLTGLSNSFGITNLTNAGSYTLSVAGMLANPNYTVSSANAGTWAVNPATLLYVATPASTTAGDPIPTLTGTVSGFVNGQTLAAATTGTAVYTTAATANSVAGNYAVTGSGLTANNGDYVFAQAPGNATALTLTGASTPSTTQSTSSSDTTVTQQTTQFVQTASYTQPTTTGPVVTIVDTTTSNTTTAANDNTATTGNSSGGSSSGGGASGGGNSGGSGGTGSQANGKHGGNGTPPGTRLVDLKFIPLPNGSGMPPPGETRFVDNEVVLQFAPGTTQQQIDDMARRFGLSLSTQQDIGVLGRSIFTFRLGNGETVRDVIAAIEAGGFGAAVQPNYTFGLSQDQNVQVASLGDPAQYIVEKLQLGAVHRISKGDHVLVALIDSKIDTEQPDIAGAVTDEFDAGCGVDAAPDPHGTGMAGAIASHLNLLGVAPGAKLIAICAFGGHGTPESSSVKIIKGLDYAIQHGAKIVNMSFAGPRDPAVAQELQIAREKGLVLIGAAGNDGPNSPPLYPGADPNVIAVTATDENDRVFRGANQGEYVALAAPGVDILVPAPHSGVQFTTGTSVATAHVSGVAALLMAEQPTLSPEQIRSILTSTAKHYAAKGSERKSGAGVIDPLKALRLKPLS